MKQPQISPLQKTISALRTWGYVFRTLGLLVGIGAVLVGTAFCAMAMPVGFVVGGIGVVVVIGSLWLSTLHDAAAEVIRLLGR